MFNVYLHAHGHTHAYGHTHTHTALTQCKGPNDFPMLEIGDIFGINTDLRIDPNTWIANLAVRAGFPGGQRSIGGKCRSLSKSQSVVSVHI